MFLKQIATLAKFTPEKMGKADLAKGDFLFAGLNSFEPGQEHAPHKHEGQDKLYVILQGTAAVRIGEEEQSLTVGDAAFARSGVIHAIRNTGEERLIAMAILSPPPAK